MIIYQFNSNITSDGTEGETLFQLQRRLASHLASQVPARAMETGKGDDNMFTIAPCGLPDDGRRRK